MAIAKIFVFLKGVITQLLAGNVTTHYDLVKGRCHLAGQHSKLSQRGQLEAWGVAHLNKNIGE